MFDRSFLPNREFSFVVVSDTHYMLPQDDVEFESRSAQTARVRHALDRIDSLDPEFVVHLGDLVQEFPGRKLFDEALNIATDQLSRISARWYPVAGNHDVGDKPDPLMPTDWTTERSLEAYHERFGRSWYSWVAHGRRFAVINSQILNSGLNSATDQREWLETVLEESNEPVMLFLHLPPFLHRESEPSLGHYDNVDQPARTWLLELIQSSPVTHVFAGHSHFEFRTTLGNTLFHVVPSVSFTRPGFGEVFSSPPAAEQGRDDRDKLGFYLVRVDRNDVDVHRILTHGSVDPIDDSAGKRLLTGTTSTLPASRVGASLLRPLGDETRISATFPSSVPQPVRNDYPMLGCLEAGIGTIRIPVEETASDGHWKNVNVLRESGTTIVMTTFLQNIAALDETGAIGDELEVRIPTGSFPPQATLRQIESIRRSRGVQVTLSTVVPNRTVAGKQHDRLRMGYAVDELGKLDDHLETHNCSIDRILCQVKGSTDPWDVISNTSNNGAFRRIGAVDYLVRLHDLSHEPQLRRVATAVFAAGSRRKSRIYLEPLRSLDRTMDTAHGLLDRRCNPTAGFHAVRCLNTILFATRTEWSPYTPSTQFTGSLRGLNGGDRHLWLISPDPGVVPMDIDISLNAIPDGTTRAVSYSFEDREIIVTDHSTDSGISLTVRKVTLLEFK